jgi:hypothetical protein
MALRVGNGDRQGVRGVVRFRLSWSPSRSLTMRWTWPFSAEPYPVTACFTCRFQREDRDPFLSTDHNATPGLNHAHGGFDILEEQFSMATESASAAGSGPATRRTAREALGIPLIGKGLQRPIKKGLEAVPFRPDGPIPHPRQTRSSPGRSWPRGLTCQASPSPLR